MGNKGLREISGTGKKMRKHSFKIRFIFVSIVYSLWSMVCMGCGYSTHSLVSPSHKTVYIEPFTNKIDLTGETSEFRRLRTYYPLLENKVTQAIVDRFIFDGNFKVVQKESADLDLKGELIDYSRDALRYTDADEPEEYRISIRVNLELWDTKENKLLWKEANFIGDTTYFTRGTLSKSEVSAIDAAVVDLARRIVERTVEIW